jgi:CheY-like chemotaxis protein
VHTQESSTGSEKPSILHVSPRDILRTVRDQILRVSGYEVTSSDSYENAREILESTRYDLVLIDIQSEGDLKAADEFCALLKRVKPEQKVAFVCNWRVAIISHCPDDVVRSEFDPAAFVSGVNEVVRA